MINYISHKKSNQVVDGLPKLPTADQLKEGEIAINYANGYETLSIKNSDNEIATFSSTEQIEKYVDTKLGSGFTSGNSANTVTSVIESNEKVVSASLNDLNDRKLDYSGVTTDTAMTYTASSASGVKLSHTKRTALNDNADLGSKDSNSNGKLKVIKTDDFGHVIDSRDATAADIEGLGVASKWKAGQGNGAVLLKNSNGSAAGEFSVSEGKGNTANGNYSHAEGSGTTASGDYSHAEGSATKASGYTSHAEGSNTKANGSCSHAEGERTTASGSYSHAEGYVTTASGNYSHAEGYDTTASGFRSHAEGDSTNASGYYSHAEGGNTTASSNYSHAEGYRTTASGKQSHTEGSGTTASGSCSHAEGGRTTASGNYSHAEGGSTTASGYYSHAEGYGTTASGYTSHAEGENTIANRDFSHAEGGSTTASGDYSHAEGFSTTASGVCSHAEGKGTSAQGENSHAEGLGTITTNIAEHASGKYNQSNPDQIYSIGVGTDNDHRRNAIMVMQNGDTSISGGTLNVSGDTHFHGPYNYLSGTTIIENLSATSGTFDTALSETSTNAVQNSAITKVIFENEKVTAASLNDLNDRKLDASAYTPTDLSDYYKKEETSAKTELDAAFNSKANSTDLATKANQSDLTAHTGDTTVHITSDERTKWNNAATNNHTHANKDVLDTITAIDTELSKTSNNLVVNSAITKVLIDNEKVVSAALNDLNDRKLDINYTGFTGTTLSGVTSIIQAIQKIADKLDGTATNS